jgi:branched-chain amino acid transport system substrate-binding protein
MFALAKCDPSTMACARTCTQSTQTSDCGANQACSANGTCPLGSGCTSSAQCASMGPYYACRKSQCVNLVTPLCTTVYTSKSNPMDALQDDNAVFFGSILPTAANADGPYGHLVEDSIKLALDDFRTVDGIPGLKGASTRPLVLVGCNDGVNEDQTDVAAKHLINDVGVPAIIGYAFSGNTLQVAKDVTIPGNTLLFSPSATSKLITDLEPTDNALVWRTCPSDNVQAQALTLWYGNVETAARAKYPMIPANNIKVAIVNHSDAYGSGLGDALESTLMFNGKSAVSQSGTGGNYLRVNYGMSTSPDLSKIPDIVNFAPHVVFLFGFNEGPDQLFAGVENKWPTAGAAGDSHFPFWVFSDGGEVSSLWASNMGTPADLAKPDQRLRISGTVPGVNSTSWPAYGTFLIEFSGSSYGSKDGSADTIGPAGAYDILFLLAYSTVMVGQNPLTGPNLVKYGLSQMQKTPGLPQFKINRNDILTTFPQLTTGKPIDVTGVSGPLPFNGKGDITTADIQIWCVPPNPQMGGDVGTAAINSGCYFDSGNAKMAGSVGSTCALQGYTCQ